MQGPDELSRRVLYRLGYLMGRYVYLCDALDDIESDLKKHRYNPFILAEGLTAGDEEKTAAVRRPGRWVPYTSPSPRHAKPSIYWNLPGLVPFYPMWSTWG